LPRVLIVDDSAVARRVLTRILSAAEDIEVVGEAADRPSALTAAQRLSPDVVTMDVRLGEDDGVSLTAELMAEAPTRVLIVTGALGEDATIGFRAIEAGALDILPKPHGGAHPARAREERRLIRAVRALAAVPVVRRRPPRRPRRPARRLATDGARARRAGTDPGRLIVVGASTGGPGAIFGLLSAVPRELSHALPPIVVVQHIVAGFGAGFAKWLAGELGRPVRVARAGERLEPGAIVVAPDDAHVVVTPELTTHIDRSPPRRYQRPSVDVLFESAAALGSQVDAVLLTGMGSDGAQGLAALREAGARTFAQEPAQCVVDAMPAAAIALNAACHVLPVEEIAAALLSPR